MTFYEELREVAAEVLAEFDQSLGTGAVDDGLWYVEVTPGSGPVDNPGPSTTKRYKLDATARGVSAHYVDGALIVATDLQLTTPARDDVRPDNKGFIDMDGVQHKIVEVHHIPPSGVAVAHRIFFRK